MQKSSKGRPAVAEKQRKDQHYSVWLSTEQKREIDELIKASNLPASQFFLTQVLERPIKRPNKKHIPANVAQKIVNLEKLSGLLSLSVLKTKDREMIADNWAVSSQNVRTLIEVIKCWVFHDFALPQMNKMLEALDENMLDTIEIIEGITLIPEEEKLFLVDRIRQEENMLKKIKNDFQNHYLIKEILINSPWLESELDDIHKQIKSLLDQQFQNR